MPTVTMQITNGGLNLRRDGASGANNPKITYVAVGNGTSTPTASQTKLDNEQFRKAVTSYTNGIAAGEILIDCYLSPVDAVGLDIEEIAIFGGSGAVSTANSGVMLGRALWTHNPKSAQESIDLRVDLVG